MLRLAWIILALAAVSVGVVHFRGRQEALRSEMHRLQAERLRVRRTLWDQQLRLGELTSPWEVYRRVQGWPSELIGPDRPAGDAQWAARQDR